MNTSEQIQVSQKNTQCVLLQKVQECIPVGHVPHASVAVSAACKPPCHACPPAMHAPQPHMLPCHACPFPHHACPLTMYTPLRHAHTPTMHTPLSSPGMPPPQTEGMIHACENITFPQLLLRAVNIPCVSWFS